MKNNKHKITSLPKWAQSCIAAQNADIEILKKRIENLENSHSLLFEYEWFAIRAPFDLKEGEFRHLWLINKDDPHAVCSLGCGDKLLVLRRKKTPINISNSKIQENKQTKKQINKKNNQKYGRVPKRYYNDICFIFSSDVEKFHGKEWTKKFNKIFGIGNTCPVIPADHPDNKTGKDIGGIFYDDYERFADLIDYEKPTFFD